MKINWVIYRSVFLRKQREFTRNSIHFHLGASLNFLIWNRSALIKFNEQQLNEMPCGPYNHIQNTFSESRWFAVDFIRIRGENLAQTWMGWTFLNSFRPQGVMISHCIWSRSKAQMVSVLTEKIPSFHLQPSGRKSIIRSRRQSLPSSPFSCHRSKKIEWMDCASLRFHWNHWLSLGSIFWCYRQPSGRNRIFKRRPCPNGLIRFTLSDVISNIFPSFKVDFNNALHSGEGSSSIQSAWTGVK